jgi:hypothetical protein
VTKLDIFGSEVANMKAVTNKTWIILCATYKVRKRVQRGKKFSEASIFLSESLILKFNQAAKPFQKGRLSDVDRK